MFRKTRALLNLITKTHISLEFQNLCHMQVMSNVWAKKKLRPLSEQNEFYN